MKKTILNSLLTLVLFVNIILSSFAGCHTGFACSIDDLQQEQNRMTTEYINNLNYYFAKKAPERNFVTGQLLVNNYNDIFTFNTIV